MNQAPRPDSVDREVLFEVQGSIARIRLNRPEARNAVNGMVVRAMDWIVDKVEKDNSIMVAVLESATPNMFCAGADLGEIARGGGADLVSKSGGFAGFVKAARTKVWIASVDGPAMGGGFELALACDIIVASHGALFGLPEVRRGLMAVAGGAIRLPRLLPRGLAFEAIASGDPITPETALAHGMINRLVAQDELVRTTLDLARRIAGNAPLAVRESLIVARAASRNDDEALWQANDEAMMRVMTSSDAREGPRAFMEKRDPRWSGT